MARAHHRGDLPACGPPVQHLSLPDVDSWHALIDFYARHDCGEYRMPHDYRPRTQAGPLPVCPGQGRAR